MSLPLRIAIPGALGRMGQLLVREVVTGNGLALTATSERPGHAALGQDTAVAVGLPACGVALAPELGDAQLAGDTDIVIDFTVPAATVALVTRAADAGCRLVIGTTGLDQTQRAAVAAAAERTAIVFAPNTSVGINVLLRLVADAARMLGDDFDLEIVEAHHKHKRDAPSGTALRLAEALAEATAQHGSLKERACYGREGIAPRQPKEIGIHTVRGGDVAGEHSVLYLGEGERITLSHSASSRQTFARGAMRAARWVADREPGLYDMRDVLGLSA